jgi:hypothetical protein
MGSQSREEETGMKREHLHKDLLANHSGFEADG